MYLIISVLFIAAILKLWGNKLTRTVSPINDRIAELSKCLSIFTGEVRALIKMIVAGQVLLAPIPQNKDKRIETILKYFENMNDKVAKAAYDSLYAEESRDFPSLTRKAFEMMNVHC